MPQQTRTGGVEPSLDQLAPTAAQVKEKVERGSGGMPAFAGQLTDEQIRDVAEFADATTGS